jgi:hypothetical protein
MSLGWPAAVSGWLAAFITRGDGRKSLLLQSLALCTDTTGGWKYLTGHSTLKILP